MSGRPGMTPELIVVHGISLPPGRIRRPMDRAAVHGRAGSQRASLFRDDRVPCGSRLTCWCGATAAPVQFVPFGLRAWHAGVSSWQGRSACNDFSIGIEMEGTDEGALRERAVSDALRADCRVVRCLPEPGAGAGGRSQRHRAGPQERSGSEIRVETAERRYCPEGLSAPPALAAPHDLAPLARRASTRASMNSRSESRFR